MEAATTTATGVRRRADGSTSTVRMTTETLKLSDAPVSREREVQTTATVRVQDGTTRARGLSEASVPRPVLEPALANPQPDRGNHSTPEAKLD